MVFCLLFFSLSLLLDLFILPVYVGDFQSFYFYNAVYFLKQCKHMHMGASARFNYSNRLYMHLLLKSLFFFVGVGGYRIVKVS